MTAAVTPGREEEMLARWLEAEARNYTGETAIYSAGHVGNILKTFATRVRLAAKPADEDSALLDWLEDEDNPVETIYLDDGTLIDFGGNRGRKDLRTMLREARALSTTKAPKP